MEHEPLRLGRISKKMENALKADFGDDIFLYIEEKTLSSFAEKWPSDYLKKVEEIGKIIKKALYIGLSDDEKTLYLIDEYITKTGFRKVVVEFVKQKEGWSLKEMSSLTEKSLEELWKKAKIYRLT